MRFPSWIWFSLIALVILSETGAAVFRFVADTWNAGGSHAPVLRFRVPEELRSHYRELEVEPRQVKDLSFDRASRYQVSLTGGRAVEIVSIEYDGGNKNYWNDAYYHAPERCMSLAGSEVAEVYPDQNRSVIGQETVWVRGARIRTNGPADFYVFRGAWMPHRADGYAFNPRTDWVGWSFEGARIMRAFSLHPTPAGLIHVAGVHGAKTFDEACRIFEEVAVKPLRMVKS